MKDAFSTFHPGVIFLWFVVVLFYAMFFMHPVCLIITASCAVIYAIYLNGTKAIRFNLKYMLPLFILTALLNPLFNHQGATILTYLYGGNPLTLESILYGMATALMLISVITWFSCYNVVMTTDKFIYLFGRLIPALSLIFSMTLRLVPRFKAQLTLVANAQQGIAPATSTTSWKEKITSTFKLLSIMVTWGLENSIETTDSMKSRGYGLPGRSSFALFIMDKRDKYILALISLLTTYLLVGSINGSLYYRYFPTLKVIIIKPYTLSLYIIYLGLCLLPLIINWREDRRWKAIQ